MKKSVLFFLLILTLTMVADAAAQDINMDISDAEDNIRNAATITLDYSTDMIIDSHLVDSAAKTALSDKKKYENSEISKYKDLNTDIVINLKKTGKKLSFKLDSSLSNYSEYIDNIIINADGLYCYINPSDFCVTNMNSDVVKINIEDKDNIVAKYTGKDILNKLKIILVIMLVVIAVYIMMFLKLFVLKKQFKDGYNKKKIYVISICMAVFCIIAAVLLSVWDNSDMAVRQSIEVEDGDSSFFEISVNDSVSQDSVNGIFMGIPLYSDSFNSEKTTVCMKSKDTMQGDKIIGGHYITSYDIIKFAVNESGEYYLRNNNVEFSDIRESDEGLYEAVSALSSQNILSGKAEGIYGLNDTVTRAETVTMLCKMLSINQMSSNSEPFDDVKNEDWYYKYVMIGKNYGILSGYDDNTFRAGNSISRQEFAATLGQIMVNKMGYILPESTELLYAYSDSDSVSGWASKYVALLERENINIWQNAYQPYEPITRGEAAMMIYRVYCLMK